MMLTHTDTTKNKYYFLLVWRYYINYINNKHNLHSKRTHNMLNNINKLENIYLSKQQHTTIMLFCPLVCSVTTKYKPPHKTSVTNMEMIIHSGDTLQIFT
eukprot:GHVR01108147.1.p1 GENE.GHVR01108147.1~~GHVR01108147.1.p1  ORF type:complete len:100 (+),score=15.27 GHVR01108147.1:211-510(+)